MSKTERWKSKPEDFYSITYSSRAKTSQIIYSIPACLKLRKNPLPGHRMAVPHRATAGPTAAASERRDEKLLIGTSREFHNRPRKRPTIEQKAFHILQLSLHRTHDSCRQPSPLRLDAESLRRDSRRLQGRRFPAERGAAG